MRLMIGSAIVLFLYCQAARAGGATTQPSISLKGIDGETYEPLVVTGHQAAVILFVLQDCPICNGYAPQVQRLVGRFGPRKTQFYLVHVDPALTTEAARAHAKAYGYSIPIIIDRKHELVARLGVVAVPTAVVLGPDGTVKYVGRIDDQYVAIGKSRTVATRFDLRDAIAATLDGKPVRESRTPAIGCAVPDLPAGK